ncbi:BQ2448_4900 [Microbotryum intermedium]|uniref:BQ2448_4900 protein n=1 Tax=Microbotryum intermedium TaxID=269621 RepID=A0A238FM98_9BASI|nr:BQ2448_4900 [Microbotryum intermedium]
MSPSQNLSVDGDSFTEKGDLDTASEVTDVEKGARPRRHFASLASMPTIPVGRSTHFGTQPLSRQDHRTLSRTNSILLTSGPVRANPHHKLPVVYRTLSIQVTETRQGRESYKKKAIQDLASLEWHTLPTEEVCTRLGVSPVVGLDTQVAQRRLAKNGKNVISPPPRNLPRKIFFYIFGGFGSLLMGGAIICFLSWKPLGNPNPQASNLVLAVVLIIVIAMQASFNAWQDYSTGRTMASISGMLPSDVLVCRDGNTFTIPASDLVAGDVVKVTLGSKVPADLRLIECSADLRFDQSILTGESNPISGTTQTTDANFMESRNIALQGTLCFFGSGIGICVGLGDSTVFGRIAKDATGERPVKTSLEVEISRFVLIIGSLAASVASLIVIFWAAFLRRKHPDFINVPTLLIDCVSVAIAFIPEGLPVCVMLSLTVIASSMKKKNIMCKTLATVESLGCVSVICSDKTGTLTQNRMTVVDIVVADKIVSTKEAQALAAGGKELSANRRAVMTLSAIAGLCNDAAFGSADTNLPTHERKVNGDATDTGLFRFAEDISRVADLRALWKVVGKLAFNSKNKFAIKVFKPFDSEKHDATQPALLGSDDYRPEDCLMLVKGAPDVLIKRCSTYMDMKGQILVELAEQGKRVLLLARKVIRQDQANGTNLDNEDALLEINTDLTIVGLAALVDPLRDDTADTVRVCRGAGIRFMMVTGDMSVTAVSIARSAGIITASKVHRLADLPCELPETSIAPYDDHKVLDAPLRSIALSGPELITMTASQWSQVMSFDEVVFARTSPQQKLQIVKSFQSAGCTVAVTGDGCNDAPALKQADVGVAVAGGSEVAMEAADLILLENFSAIVVGIESGRLCFENLRKSILYLLPAGSFSELMPVLVNVFFGLPQVLSNIQMILICAVTDVLPALSLCFEKPEADLLLRKPRDRKKERLADAKLLGHAYFFLGVPETLTAMTGAFYFGFHRHGVPFSSLWLNYSSVVDAGLLSKAQSIYFFNLVLMQWFNLLSTRTRGLSIVSQNPLGSPRTRNYRLFPAMVAALLFAIAFSYIPWFQKIFETTTVGIEFYALPLAYGVGLLICDEVRKAINRRYPDGRLAKMAW